MAGEEVSCLDKALQLLAQRSHFEAELRRKLLRRDYPQTEVEQILAVLRRDGVIDDESVAAEFVALRRRRRGEGSARIRQELLRRGVDEDLAQRAAAETSDDDELRRARDLAAARSGRGAEEASIGRFLARKGYSTRVILLVLEELRRSDDESAPPAVDAGSR